MRLISKILIFFAIAMLSVTLVIVSCGDDDDDDDDNDELEDVPKVYDTTIDGWAFGDGLYRYAQGHWNKESQSPFNVQVIGSVFTDRSYGFVYSGQRIYQYRAGDWIPVNNSNFPPGSITDATFIPNGSAWFAVNNAYGRGSLVGVTEDAQPMIFDSEGTLASVPLKLSALFQVPEDNALHLCAVVPEATDYFFQHLRWDGTTVTSEVMFRIDFMPVDPPADDDDTTTDDDTTADDDTAGDDDQPEWLQMVDILDMKTAPDGTIWAAGWDRADDATPRGALWHRVANGEEITWERTLLETSTGCKTTMAKKFVYAPDTGRAFVIADCGNSQIYRQNDDGSWSQMLLPGIKGSTYRINDLSLVTETKGWAVGYTSDKNAPLLLVRSTAGWEIADARTFDVGDELFSAALYSVQSPGGFSDDDTTADDDTTTDDDTTGDDDTTTDDDTTADDDDLVGDDDTVGS
ncbi:MAG: hypothetical protein P9L99_13975 [Candidatus Lernaella stagnicola]|nr:hypothetical protein [Candidatus Lernaella stagnicola]